MTEQSICRALPYSTQKFEIGNEVQNNSVFVKGFGKLGWNHEDLYSKFCTIGKIISCKVSSKENYEFLSHGYIQFSKMEEA